jgi:hypothetical protein
MKVVLLVIVSAGADSPNATGPSLDSSAPGAKHSGRDVAPRGRLPIYFSSKTYPPGLRACERHASDEVFSYPRYFD